MNYYPGLATASQSRHLAGWAGCGVWRKNKDLEAYFVAGSSPAGVEVTTRYAWVHVGNVGRP